MYIELTVNRDTATNNSDKINDLLNQLGYKVILISNEVTQITNNTHFHVLIELNEQQAESIVNTLNDVYVSTNYIARKVKNLNATILYFIKDGKYKTYNGYFIPNDLKRNKIDMQLLVKDIVEGMTYSELVIKYGMVIIKNAYGINHLIGSINKK